MIFDAAHATYLVLWIVFVFWQPFRMSRKQVQYYEMGVKALRQYGVSASIFGPVWFTLYSLQVAFIFIFMSWTIDIANYTFLTVYILFLVNTLVGKTWTWLFFELKSSGMALMTAMFMWATALAIVILLGLTENIGANGVTPDNFKWLLFGLYIPYLLWLTFAVLLNMEWMRAQGGYMNSWFSFSMRVGPSDADASVHLGRRHKAHKKERMQLLPSLLEDEPVVDSINLIDSKLRARHGYKPQ